MVLVDLHPVVICNDPECKGWAMPDDRHFDLHNKPCARPVNDGLCGLVAGHSGDCNPVVDGAA